MNTKISTFLALTFFFCFSYSASAVVSVKPANVDSLASTNQILQIEGSTALEQSGIVKKGWKKGKGVKRMKRIVKRLFKKNNSFGDVFSSRRFRIGAILLLGGIVAGSLVGALGMAQIIGWLAGVAALVGLIMMIWALIEHS